MAIATGDGLCVPSVPELSKILVVDVAGHRDHEARRLLDGILVGRVVDLRGLRIFVMAVSTGNAKLLLIPVHQLVDFRSRLHLRAHENAPRQRRPSIR